MFSSNQDFAFSRAILADDVLAMAVEWISGNLRPYEVFDYDVLIKDIQDEAYKPEDIFHEVDLEDWAFRNGYRLGDDK